MLFVVPVRKMKGLDDWPEVWRFVVGKEFGAENRGVNVEGEGLFEGVDRIFPRR